MSDDGPETELTDDPGGRSHREINPETGQQLAYVVLSDDERAKGFVEPVRTKYVHKRCGGVTVIGTQIAETYARDPSFYNGTFCAVCKAHFRLAEFVWDGTDYTVGSRTTEVGE